MDELFKISVIVPVFQANKVIKRCVNSLLNQSFYDFEILLIDDGSTDGSENICDDYAYKYENIKVFHQKNGGPSNARNKGIERARGEYIVFVDADDFVGEDFLKGFFKIKEDPKEALVQQGYTKQKGENSKKQVSFPPETYKGEQLSQFFIETAFIKNFPFPWAKLYDRSVIIYNDIKFKKDIHYGEDLIFVLDYILRIKEIVVVDSFAYYYVDNEKSLSAFYQEYRQEIQRFLYVKERVDLLYDKFKLSPKVHDLHYEHMANYLTRVFSSLYVGKSKKQRQTRIKIYRNFEPGLYGFFQNNYKPRNGFHKIFKLLLINRLFIILDLFMQIRFNGKIN